MLPRIVSVCIRSSAIAALFCAANTNCSELILPNLESRLRVLHSSQFVLEAEVGREWSAEKRFSYAD